MDIFIILLLALGVGFGNAAEMETAFCESINLTNSTNLICVEILNTKKTFVFVSFLLNFKHMYTYFYVIMYREIV